MTISRHPEPCANPRPFLAVRPTRESSFRATCPPVVSPTDEREELDPCSLDTAAFFGARLPSLFEARRRLPTSATTIRRAGNQTRALSILAGREASTSILFSRARRLSLAGVADTRRAALRPFAMAPVLVPPACAGLPSRDATSIAPPPRDCSPRRIVRIDVHGSKNRAKDASPSACDDLSCLRRVHTLCGACRRRSPPRLPSDIRCHRRARGWRRIPPLACGPT